jgi:hypothetical protein
MNPVVMQHTKKKRKGVDESVYPKKPKTTKP